MTTNQKDEAEKLHLDILPAEARKPFRKEISAACDLLNFAITEGKLGISDSMVEQITRAQKFLDRKALPTSGDRANFEKAYRELAQVLCPISAESVRAISPLRWVQEYLYLPIVLSVSFLAALFLLGS